MNIVFWFLVVVMLIAVWIYLRNYFNRIGNFLFDLFDDTKKEILDESQEHMNEEDKK